MMKITPHNAIDDKFSMHAIVLYYAQSYKFIMSDWYIFDNLVFGYVSMYKGVFFLIF